MSVKNLLEKIRIVEVNTTAFEEENFVLLTDLSDEQITEVIKPIVEKERNAKEDDEESYYGNSDLVEALQEVYPENVIIFYTDKDSIEEIKI